MSLFDYLASREISGQDFPFYGLLMALMRAADSENEAKLKAAFPLTYYELRARYNAPGGIIADDGVDADP